MIILDFVIFLLLLLSVYLYFSAGRKAKLSNGINTYLKNIHGNFSYENIEDRLRRHGNPFNLTPLGYLTGKVLMAAILLFFLIISKLYIAIIPVCIIAYFFIDILMFFRDRNDMKRIRIEFKKVYDLINIQMAAGTFIGNVLTECYLAVSFPRLKKSFSLLSAEISITGNIEQSLDNFAKQYKENEDIISDFVLTIKQSILTGQSREQLEDMSEEVSDICLLKSEENEKKISDDLVIVQILIFVGLLITLTYLVGISIGSQWSSIKF